MKIAVMISNMGGPDSLDAVETYLYNIFKDPDIIDIPLPTFLRERFVRWLARKRGPESREIYEKLGGKTPLTKITNGQAKLLEESLNKDNEHEVKVFTAMRYWHPFIEDVWAEIVKQKFDKLVVVTLYPFYSTTTTGSLEKLIERLNVNQTFANEDLTIVSRFGNEPEFIDAVVNDVQKAFQQDNSYNNILFSAHSIPMRRIKRGDPYRSEIEQAVAQISAKLPDELKVHLAYQSKLGPIEWLSPATPDKIEKLAKDGVKKLLVYPLGFVADNSETIFEIGMLYKDLANEKGIDDFVRIDSLNESPLFIDCLKNVVEREIQKKWSIPTEHVN